MSVVESEPALPKPSRRWFRITPRRCLAALLVVEGLLWLSDHYGWLPWHKGYAVLTAVALVAAALVGMILWFGLALLFRWRFQFSIRSILVLVVVVALPCSWLGVEMKKARGQRDAVEIIRKRRGQLAAFVEYDCQYDVKGIQVPYPQPLGPVWLRQLAGDDFFGNVTCVKFSGTEITDIEFTEFVAKHSADLPEVESLSLACTQITDNGLSNLGEFRNLRFLDLSHTQITGEGLRHLQGLSKLETLPLYGTKIADRGIENLNGLAYLACLELQGTAITDAGIEKLNGLPKLKKLGLSMTRITDKGLRYLKDLSSLQELDLWQNKISDSGVTDLQGMKQLTRVNLLFTGVSDEGVKKLQQALPNCAIVR